MTDRQYHANAFTMLEALLTLLILSVTIFSFSQVHQKPSLEIVCKKIMNLSVMMQERAYSQKMNQYVQIHHNEAFFEDTVLTFPNGIVCEGYDYHYNAKGNINQGGTITCTDGSQVKRIVVHLGSGRMRLE